MVAVNERYLSALLTWHIVVEREKDKKKSLDRKLTASTYTGYWVESNQLPLNAFFAVFYLPTICSSRSDYSDQVGVPRLFHIRDEVHITSCTMVISAFICLVRQGW